MPLVRDLHSLPRRRFYGSSALPYQHFRPVNRMNVIAGCILAFRIMGWHRCGIVTVTALPAVFSTS